MGLAGSCREVLIIIMAAGTAGAMGRVPHVPAVEAMSIGTGGSLAGCIRAPSVWWR